MLTNLQVKALKPTNVRYLKTDASGLCIDVLPSGEKSWVHRYRLYGKQHKTWLGRYPAMSLADARAARDRQAALVRDGKDPAEEKKRLKKEQEGGSTNPTVREFCDRYFRKVVEGRRSSAQTRRYIDKEICPRLGDKLLRDVTVLDIQNLVYRKSDAKKIRTALHLRGVLKRIFAFALHEGLATYNPAEMVKPMYIGKTITRERSLSPGEIRIFLRTVDDSDIARPFKIALRLLLLTMVRKGELLQARWDQVDLEAGVWLIPGAVTKTGKPHAVYLCAQVSDLFRELKVFSCGSQFVLPGVNIRKPLADNTLNAALDRLDFDGVPHFVIHDMRRTSSTILNSNGFSGDAIEAALGHSISGVRGVYNRSTYAAERKKMLQWWADYIDSLVDGSNLLVGNFGA